MEDVQGQQTDQPSLLERYTSEQVEAIAEDLGAEVLTDQEQIEAFYQACQDYWREHPPTKP